MTKQRDPRVPSAASAPASGTQGPGSPATGAGRVTLPGLGTVATIRRDCPCCGTPHDRQPLFGRDVWALYRCPRCDLVYLDPVPDYASLSEVAAWERSWAQETVRRTRDEPLRKRLSNATRIRVKALRQSMTGHVARSARDGPVLDLGCSRGDLLMALPDRFVPYGIEIAADAARHARQRVAARGGDVTHAPAIEGLRRFGDGFFSAVMMSSYLEHEIEPLPVLRETARVLAPGGVVVIKVPNFASWNRSIFGDRWCGLRYPDHVNQFTPSTLAALAARAGLRTRIGPLMRLPTSDSLWAVLHKDADRDGAAPQL